MINLSRPVVRRTLGAAASAGVALALLAGCSSSPSAVASTGGTTGTNTGGTGGTNQNANPAFPGASGQIAAVSGKTLQVQGASSQTAVTYTDSTKITEAVSAAESDLAVGKCVSVSPVASTNTSGATGTAPDLSAPITAASVSISDAVNGTCMRGGGMGGGGGHRSGATGATGAGAPSGSATGATGAGGPGGPGGGMRGFGGGGANGMIASISGDTMTVTTMARPAAATGATGSSGATTVTRTVTLDSSTTYTKTESAAGSALTVGKCVNAVGTSDSSGAITASSISIRPMVNGACSTGFGRRGMGGGGFGGGTGAPPAAAQNG